MQQFNRKQDTSEIAIHKMLILYLFNKANYNGGRHTYTIHTLIFTIIPG
jgi:hypothetical protein